MVRGAWGVVDSVAATVLLGATPLPAQQIPQLPDSSGWGVHVLALARGPDSSIWVGTYGQGIFVLQQGAGSWEQIRPSGDTSARSISWGFVHAFAFGPRGEIWYGTVGNGWGLSTDGGKTWTNWEYRQLGPEWQYVAPNGIITRGDTVYIATADGIKLTWDDGATWAEITDSAGATRGTNLWGRIANQYVLAIAAGRDGSLWVSHLRGVEGSKDGGRTWRRAPATSSCEAICIDKLRSLSVDSGGRVWVGAAFARDPLKDFTMIGARSRAAPLGPAETPGRLKHTWFHRPIALEDQPYIDQTYRYGSTMGGNFQQHQGVEFNNPDGTPVHAIGDGVVVFAGSAEAGALTVAIRHDFTLRSSLYGSPVRLFSVYYHNSKLLVRTGQRVKAGDVISLVGNTGRATNDHLHLEVHAAPTDSVQLIVDPNERYPKYTTNPELWIESLAGTGVVAGQVWDSQGQPVRQARIYGLVKGEPQETPFSYAETYGDRAHSDPVYQEHFAVGDVGPGEYCLGVEIEGKKVYRRVRVEAGKLTWLEFRPDAH